MYDLRIFRLWLWQTLDTRNRLGILSGFRRKIAELIEWQRVGILSTFERKIVEASKERPPLWDLSHRLALEDEEVQPSEG